MARHTTITDTQILDAAREVFLDEGFSALTSTIAHRAGVSEGSIFKRYPTKESLFFAALEIPERPVWHNSLERLAGSGDTKQNLETLCIQILTHVHAMMPRIITAMGSRICPHGQSPFAGMPEPPPVRDLRLISEYIAKEAIAGRLTATNPPLVARIILGTLVHHAFGMFAEHRDPSAAELESIARGMVEILWAGIGPVS